MRWTIENLHPFLNKNIDVIFPQNGDGLGGFLIEILPKGPSGYYSLLVNYGYSIVASDEAEIIISEELRRNE